MKTSMKCSANCALAYALVAMVCGVFYREFTKFMGFTGDTVLSVVHTHYFALGMLFFLLLLLLQKNFSLADKPLNRILAVYHVGLNVTGIMFLVRGILQVLETPLSSGLNAAISGMAGIGHILLGVAIVLILVQLRKAVKTIA